MPPLSQLPVRKILVFIDIVQKFFSGLKCMQYMKCALLGLERWAKNVCHTTVTTRIQITISNIARWAPANDCNSLCPSVFSHPLLASVCTHEHVHIH